MSGAAVLKPRSSQSSILFKNLEIEIENITSTYTSEDDSLDCG